MHIRSKEKRFVKFRIEKNCTSQKDYVTNEFEESFFERLYESLPEADRL